MNLYIVESPFQLLSAIEAREAFGLGKDNSILVLKYSKNLKSNRQMTELAVKFEFSRVITLSNSFAITLNDAMLIILIAVWKYRKKNFNFLFLGEVKNVVSHIAAINLSFVKCFFLDDGISTLKVQRDLHFGVKINDQNYANELLSHFNFILAKIFFLKHGILPDINWFTCFELVKLPEQLIVTHTFSAIKELFGVSKKTGDMLFIGSPISEDKKMDQADEIESIRNAIKYFDNVAKVTYCIHRRESREKIRHIAKIPKIITRESKYPLEMELLIQGFDQFQIASFFSTALHTIPLIFDVRSVSMFALDETKLADNFRDVYRDILSENASKSAISLIKDYGNK